MIRIGNCLEVMPTLPADHFDSIVTDPPYGLSFMGKGWDHAVPGAEFWAEALRVAKPGTFLAAFGGTRTFHRLACAIEDAGWELRDTLMWVYGSGFPKSHNGPWGGTALKPAWEPIILARKPLLRTVAATFEAHGTGGLRIDPCGIGANFSDGGRWPANLIHDGSDEVLAAFPSAPGQQGDLRAQDHVVPQGNAFGQFGPKRAHKARRDGEASAERRYAEQGATDFAVLPGMRRQHPGSASRFFYCAKADRADRDDGCEWLPRVQGGQVSNTSGQHITRRDGGAPGLVGNNHPTVKPTDLMRWLCRLVTPAGGHVLDPFAGSGSTGRGAIAEGLQFTGIEMDPAYAAIAEARIRAMQPGLALGDAA